MSKPFTYTFKRRELKYLVSQDQRTRIIRKMQPYMIPDEYGRSTICNLYYDTPTYRIIRKSLEKPTYKEKLRVRSYGMVLPNDKVFVELKKKYKGIVYKRRVKVKEHDAMQWLGKKQPCPKDTQITREIDYVLAFYEDLQPVLFLSYDREAYYSEDNSGFRVTFDDTLLARHTETTLTKKASGRELLDKDMSIMELKCPGSMPLWMAHILQEEHIFRRSFSKYGYVYKTTIHPTLKRNT